MQTQSRHDTRCELLLRSALHARGLRYRLHRRPLRGLRREADVVFGRARVAVFVDGCFWHGCRRHRTASGANRRWWEAKLGRNITRDRDTNTKLVEAGWYVVRVWEHADPMHAAAIIARAVSRKRPSRGLVVVD